MVHFSLSELGLPEDSWRPLERRGIPQHYGEGQLIYLQDTEATHFYYLKSGRVKSFISSQDGTERTLNLYPAGSLFGEASFFDERPRVSSAVAVTPCEIISIDRPTVTELIAGDPAFAMAMMKYLARTVRMLSQHVDDITFRPAEQRVASFLLAQEPDREGSLCCTQDEIAAAVGASRVTVSRILSRFGKKGWLETGYRSLRLLDREALEGMKE